MSGARQAVVLAGGKGTRLRPLTVSRPKPLLPVLGRPCVEYVIESMADAGVEEVFVTCGYRAENMVEALGSGDRFGVGITMCFEDSPAGTAGAVKLLEDRLEDTFVVASGDVLADVDVRSLVRRHIDRGAMATMALTTVERTEEFGIVGLDEEGRIERFKEKPRTEEAFSNLINAGIYVVERDVLSEIPRDEMYDFSRQLFPKMLADGRPLYGSMLDGLWKDIGRPQDLLDANLQMAGRRGRVIEIEGAECHGKIVATRLLADGCRIDGPTYIGEGASIGRDAVISSSIIGSGTEVGEGSEVSCSFMMESCALGPHCRIIGSLLGNDVIIGRRALVKDCLLGDGARVEEGAVITGLVQE